MWVYYLVICLIASLTWAQDKKQPAQQELTPEQAADQKLPNAKAWVYVYRYKELNAALRSSSVFCDEIEVAHMQNGRYFLAKVDPGHHIFRSTLKESVVEMDLKAGQKYFLRVEISTGGGGGFGVPAKMKLVPPEQGSYEVRKLRPIDANKIVNTQMVVASEQTAP